MILASCPACGAFTLYPTETVMASGNVLPRRIHVECSRCHWMGAGDAVLENNQLAALTNVTHHDHLWW